ncbi:glycosyltransferase family 2 protein [Methanohalophilus sp. RSK]|uniref:glycosyltransferase family 2 protein n=1 Tax=Methanohalophilus sp. RSK TaxID=2485783 RepID=UPI001314B38A|nr:glycosyltransferase [Methanohalophilus sp. RSK]
MKLAPIALFVYNRPDHTRKTLESLMGNPEFADSLLYIFCDGARSEKDKESVQSTRELIRSYKLENANIVENEQNKGLARSIVGGINNILQEHDRLIVLEDDCVPAPDFLHFMNACLSHYESDEKIMNVSGYTPPIEIPEDYPYDIYFSYRFSSWGWGTWKRAWNYYSNDPGILKVIENSRPLKKKVDCAGLDLYPMLRRQVYGKLNSWAVFWAINIIIEDGLSINPVRSRIMNIGHDGSGTHCSSDSKYNVKINKEKTSNLSFPEKVVPDKEIIKAYKDFHSGTLFKKVLYVCYHKFGRYINI